MPVWERAEAVLDRLDGLQSGGHFEIVTDVEPRALVRHVEELRPGHLFRHWRTGKDAWAVRFERFDEGGSHDALWLAVRKNPAFALLDESQRRRLLDCAHDYRASKGQIVCGENEPCAMLALVVEGCFALVTGAGVREHALFSFYPGDLFGIIEFFDDGMTLGRTIAVSKTTRYASFPLGIVRELGAQAPAMLHALGAMAAQRARALAGKLSAQSSQPIIARIANALLPYAVPERRLQPALAPLPQMTQTQIAAVAGTVKEVAARAIAEIEDLGGLRRERGHVRYLDRSQLLRIAKRR